MTYHRLLIVAFCVLLLLFISQVSAHEEERETLYVPVEQHSIRQSRRYRNRYENIEITPQQSIEELSAIDMEMFSRMQENDDAPPMRTFHQSRQWRKQQREEALRPWSYDYAREARQRDVVPLGFQHADTQQHGSLLELPSTIVKTEEEASWALVGASHHFEDDGEGEEGRLPTRARELKRFLQERGVACENCVELADLVNKAKSARQLPTAEDLAVAEMAHVPLFATHALTPEGESFAETTAAMVAQNPSMAQALNMALSQRAWIKSVAHCKDSQQMEWLGNFNTTLPSGCTISESSIQMMQ